jgi:hypothetical protein
MKNHINMLIYNGISHTTGFWACLPLSFSRKIFLRMGIQNWLQGRNGRWE